MMKRLGQQQTYGRRLKCSPALVAAFALLTGVLLIIGSVLSHTSKAQFSQIGKTLGYFYEVNWSMNYVVAIPVWPRKWVAPLYGGVPSIFPTNGMKATVKV